MKIVATRSRTLECLVIHQAVTSSEVQREHRESGSGHRAVDLLFWSPTDCSGKRTCGSWASSQCPLFARGDQR